jgi:hypothetical protein
VRPLLIGVGPDIDIATFILIATKPINAAEWGYTLDIDNCPYIKVRCTNHAVRIDVIYLPHPGLVSVTLNLASRPAHIANGNEEGFYNALMCICNRLTAAVEDPACQTILADKIYTTIANFFLGGTTLPNH